MARNFLPEPEALVFEELTPEKSNILSSVLGLPPRPLPDVRYVSLLAVEPDPEQPRQLFDEEKLAELAENVRLRGIEQPLVVQDLGGKYRLIAGERRWRAAQIAGLPQVPILAYRTFSEEDVDEFQLNEFLLHEEPSPVEKAQFIRAYKERNHLTWEAMSDRLKLAVPTLKKLAALTEAPPRIKELLEEKALTPAHYHALKTLPPSLMETFAERVATEEMPVSEVIPARKAFEGALPVPSQQGSILEETPRDWEGSAEDGADEDPVQVDVEKGLSSSNASLQREGISEDTPRPSPAVPVFQPAKRNRGQFTSEIRFHTTPEHQRMLRHLAADFCGGSVTVFSRSVLEWVAGLEEFPASLRDHLEGK